MSKFVSKLERPDRRDSRWSSPRIGLALFVFLAFAVASCGSDAEVDSASGSSSDVATESSDADATANGEDSPEESAVAESESAEVAAGALGNFPALNVANVSNGDTVNLQQELSGGDSPILLWFYAPH